jgi:GH24 family phage-related lysozyme (muramidase)
MATSEARMTISAEGLALIKRFEETPDEIPAAENVVSIRVKAPLTQSQFDALVSFVLNVGADNFTVSRLLAKLNMARYELASREFGKWITAGGKVQPGLVKRRQAEAAFFMRDFPRDVPQRQK